MSAGAFPKTLNFSPDPLAISARAYYSVSVPEGSSTANPSSIMRLRVPVSRAGTYLNPHKTFLAFDVVNTTSGASAEINNDVRGKSLSPIYLDGSAYSVIDRLEIYNSSNLLESISSYGLLANLFLDLQVSVGARRTASTILGTGATGVSDPLYRQMRAANAFDSCNNNFGGGAGDLANPYAEFANQIKDDPTVVGEVPRGMQYAGLNLLPYSYFEVGAVNDKSLVSTASPSSVAAALRDRQVNITLGAIGATGTANMGIFGLSYVGPPKIDRPNCVQNFTGVLGNEGSASGDEVATNLEQGAIFNSSQGGNNVMGISRLGPMIGFNSRARFCLPLISGVIGTLACRLIPICQLNSDILVNVYTASNETAICCGATPGHMDVHDISVPAVKAISTTDFPRSYRLENVELNCAIVEISSSAQEAIDSMTGGIYTIPSTSYRHYATSLQGGSTHHEFMIPARFTSLKSLIGCMRPTSVSDGGGESTQNFTLTNRIKNWMTSLQYRVGSVLVPQEPISMENVYFSTFGAEQSFANNGSASEAFAHLLECVGQSVSDLDLECCMNSSIYGNNLPTNLLSINGETATNVGGHSNNAISDGRYYKMIAEGSQSGFAFGIDLESFSTTHCSSPVQCGTNTLGLNIFCILKSNLSTTGNGGLANVPSTYTAGNGSNFGGCWKADGSATIIPVICDHFAHYDMVLSCAGGIMSSRF